MTGMFRLYTFLSIGIIAISTASIFIKLCDAPALVIATYRLILASLMLSPLTGYRKPWRGWERKDLGWFFLSGLFLSLHFALWIGALKYTSVASSVVLVTTHPIFVGVGGLVFLKERLGLNLIIGIAFSVLGSGLIGYGDMTLSREALTGDGLAFLGAIAASGYLPRGKKNEKGSGTFLLHLPCLFNGRIDIDSPLRHFSTIILRIFSLHLFLSLSPRPCPSVDRPHNLQLGPEISSGIHSSGCHFGRTHRVHD